MRSSVSSTPHGRILAQTSSAPPLRIFTAASGALAASRRRPTGAGGPPAEISQGANPHEREERMSNRARTATDVTFEPVPYGRRPPGTLILVLGVIFPATVILIEALGHMCAQTIFDPLPTVWH